MTTTIHFAGKFKGKYGKVPYCTMWAHTEKYGVTTEDKAAVNCARCAKQLGITPAAKAQKAGLARGTCPCCFRDQAVRHGMVNHGYQRPGYGYIVGNCFGAGYPSFEVSTVGTEAYRAHLTRYLGTQEERLAHLNSPACTELTYTYTTKYNEEGKFMGHGPDARRTVSVVVAVGAGNSYSADGREFIPSFTTLLTREVGAVSRTVGMVKQHIAELTICIDGWIQKA